MCSMPDPRLAEIGEAIDALAEQAMAGSGTDGEVAEFTGRVSSIWSMVAELDPGVAESLARYARGAQ